MKLNRFVFLHAFFACTLISLSAALASNQPPTNSIAFLEKILAQQKAQPGITRKTEEIVNKGNITLTVIAYKQQAPDGVILERQEMAAQNTKLSVIYLKNHEGFWMLKDNMALLMNFMTEREVAEAAAGYIEIPLDLSNRYVVSTINNNQGSATKVTIYLSDDIYAKQLESFQKLIDQRYSTDIASLKETLKSMNSNVPIPAKPKAKNCVPYCYVFLISNSNNQFSLQETYLRDGSLLDRKKTVSVSNVTVPNDFFEVPLNCSRVIVNSPAELTAKLVMPHSQRK